MCRQILSELSAGTQQDGPSIAEGGCWFLRKMGLFFPYGTGELAPTTPVGYKDRRAFRIFLPAINRMGAIGIEALDTGRPVILSKSECIFRASFSARHVTALAGSEVFRWTAGGKAIFDQYCTKPDSGTPFSVQQQVVFPHDAQPCEHGGIFQIHPALFHVVGQWLCTNPMSAKQPGSQRLRCFSPFGGFPRCCPGQTSPVVGCFPDDAWRAPEESVRLAARQ